MQLSYWNVDKLCDQVSDAVLDACIREDPASRVACGLQNKKRKNYIVSFYFCCLETCTKTGMVMIFGEITTSATVNYEQVIFPQALKLQKVLNAFYLPGYQRSTERNWLWRCRQGFGLQVAYFWYCFGIILFKIYVFRTCNVIVAIEEQSPDIAQSVDAVKLEDIGAGDQGNFWIKFFESTF